ncbi:MAG: radical SAM protein [Candidatus Altiarchaeales archaeon]|nr:radical SAM protein [Candidatus Altiarchaeales archaeon]
MKKNRMRVSEVFTSIQGEGRYIGLPQVFIRLAGCNLRCSWCDTRYAWEGGREYPMQKIIDYIEKTGLKSVCITGGEPMLQIKGLRILVERLKSRMNFVLLETNGTKYDEAVFSKVDCVSCDIKPPSSEEKSDLEVAEKLKDKDQIKIVISTEDDYYFAKQFTCFEAEVFLQPTHPMKAGWVVDQVIEDKLDFRILPQLHKLLKLR